jgi:D-tyrosyl-tRNA(Tyr) deacylase
MRSLSAVTRRAGRERCCNKYKDFGFSPAVLFNREVRALVQRVSEASVRVEGRITGQIGRGILVFLGVSKRDAESDAEFLAHKVANLRIFPDSEGKMNLSSLECTREILVVPQFTLYGDTRKGNRPSYAEAAGPERAQFLYERFLDYCRISGMNTESGVFRAHMEVRLVNDGPVTLMCYSE